MQALIATALSFVLIGLVTLLLDHLHVTLDPFRWLLSASLVGAVELAYFWHLLPRNHPPGEQQLFATLGVGTWLTLLGGLFVAMTAGFLFSAWQQGRLAWAPAILYLVSRLLDFADGYAARATDHVTELGAALDIEYDSLGLFVVILLSIQYGQLPQWYILVALARPLFVLAVYSLKRTGRSVYDMPPSDIRRIIGGYHTAFVAVTLWPIVSASSTHLIASIFAIPILVSFGRDWLIVSGTLGADSNAYVDLRATLKKWIEDWLPIAARVTVLAVVAIGTLNHSGTVLVSAQAGSWTALHMFYLFAALCFGLGLASRTMAVILIGAFLLTPFPSVIGSFRTVVVLMATVYVLLMGSGLYSLWQPEKRLILGRADKGGL